MIDDIFDLLQGVWLPVESVSDGDAFAASDLPGMGSVSGGDAPGGGSSFYQINLYALPEDPVVEIDPVLESQEESQEMQYTLWDKSLEDYTVTEGLLLILVVIAVVVLAWNMIKGGFKWLT